MDIRCVAVIGAGTMGAGIAQVCAQSGWKTHLFDAFPEGLERGMQRIDAFWEKGIARGKTTLEQKVEWSKNLHPFSDMERAVGEAEVHEDGLGEDCSTRKRTGDRQSAAVAKVLGSRGGAYRS